MIPSGYADSSQRCVFGSTTVCISTTPAPAAAAADIRSRFPPPLMSLMIAAPAARAARATSGL